MPRFSVIICTYNRAALVPNAIRSVLAQRFADFELIVVDDGSVDDTAAAVATFEDPRVRYVTRENGGISAARNTGVAAATGRYVAFLDDDDEAFEGWLEAFHLKIGTDADALVSCGALTTDDAGALLETLLPRQLGPAFDDATALFRSGTFTVTRDDYWAAGGFAEGLLCSHQTEFALRVLPLCMARGSPVRAIYEPLVRHVRRASHRRPESTPAKVLSGATFVLERHEPRLARSPSLLADWYATAGVAAARTGDYMEARRCFREARRAHPSTKHTARLALAWVRPLADAVWRTRRYRTAAGDAAGDPAGGS